MAAKFKTGDVYPRKALRNIHGAEVAIPDAKAKWVHLQFRRFAGCPICNLHLRSFVQLHQEIAAAGVHEVVVFHSSNESLLPYQGQFPFDVIGDPKKALYKEAGVEASPLALLNPAAWPAIFKGNFAKDKPKGGPEGGPLGLPADFLIAPDGKIVASHYGTHAYDQWSVEELLEKARAAA
jgi:peroxiredoxin